MSNKFGWRLRLGWTGHKSGDTLNTLGEELKDLQGRFTVLSSCALRLPNYEEQRAIELHKMEIERQRAQAYTYIQRRMNL
jgi:hypothetical protein